MVDGHANASQRLLATWHVAPHYSTMQRLQEKTLGREIPVPPPNTPEPLLSRWKILHEQCEMTVPLNMPATVGQLCWTSKGFCVITERQHPKSFTMRQVKLLNNGSFEFIKKAPPFQTTRAYPTTAVLNNKEKWCSRRPIVVDLPSPHFFRLKNQNFSGNSESPHFSMRMAYSKLFRHNITKPTSYKPRKMGRNHRYHRPTFGK